MKSTEFIITADGIFDKNVKSIETIISQTSSNWSIHIVSVAGTENDKLYKDFIADHLDKRIPDKIKHSSIDNKTNLTPSVLYNYAIYNANSEWITFVNPGFNYLPSYVEVFNANIELYKNTRLMFCNMLTKYDNYNEKAKVIIADEKIACFCINNKAARYAGPIEKISDLMNAVSKDYLYSISNVLCIYN